MIRPAQLGDLAAALKIIRAGFSIPEDQWTAKYMIKALAEPGVEMKVCDVDAEVRGLVVTQTDPTRCTVRMIAVNPDRRGQGYGKMLMGVLPTAPVYGAWVRVENTASRNLFAAAGFTPEGPANGWLYFRKVTP